MSRKASKWLPAVVVPAVIAVGVVAVPLQAGAAVNLPDKTPAQVLELVRTSTERSFSGTVVKTADLGLPNLPSTHGTASADGVGAVSAVLDALSGSQEAKIAVNGPEKVRVQIADRFAERNIVTNGTDAWYFDSRTSTAFHLAIPADARAAAQAKLEASDAADLSNPAALANSFLAHIDPSTAVSVGTDGRVAGRTVYELILTPRAADTLTKNVSISVDSETGLPLKVTVAAKGQSVAAFEVGFTSLDLTTPESGRFEFSPAPGVKVDEITVPARAAGTGSAPTPAAPRDSAEPIVTGTGWDAIVELPAASVPSELSSNPLLPKLTTAVTGGRVLTTSLVNVLLTTDGRVFAGSVPVALLQSAANK